jgi:hypothetical protein
MYSLGGNHQNGNSLFLLLVTVGLDEWANPRLRQRV